MATAQALIDQVRRTLNDEVDTAEFPYRWSNEELLRWISDGQREVVKHKPEANVVTAVFTPVVGETYQTLDFNACYKLVRVEANVVSGDTPIYGTAIRLVQRDVLDSFQPGWHSRVETVPETTGAFFRAWAACAHDPRGFYLYPTPVAGQQVWVTYAAVPGELADVEAALTLSDLYLDPLHDYTVFRAYLKRARTYSKDAAMAALTRFARQLNLSRQIIIAIAQSPSSEGPVTP